MQHLILGTNIRIHQTFKEEITVNLHKIIKRTEQVRIIPKTFDKVWKSLISKPNMDLTWKECHRFIITNIDVKILIKILEHSNI